MQFMFPYFSQLLLPIFPLGEDRDAMLMCPSVLHQKTKDVEENRCMLGIVTGPLPVYCRTAGTKLVTCHLPLRKRKQ